MNKFELYDGLRFLLVTGSMRSGTTLMSELLYSTHYEEERHPDIAFMGDKSDYIRKKLRDPSCLDDLPDFRRKVVEEVDLYSPVGRKKVIGAKQTHVTVDEALKLRQVFDDLKIIIMLRDPRDIFCSHILRTMDRSTLLDCYGMLLSNLIYFYPSHVEGVKFVEYEKLVNHPKEVISDVIKFLGLPDAYDYSGLDRGRVASNSSYGSLRGIGLEDANEGVSTGSIGKYKENLSSIQDELIMGLFGDYFKARGDFDGDTILTKNCFEFWLDVAVRTDLDEGNLSILKMLSLRVMTQNEVDIVVERSSNKTKSYVSSLIGRNKALAEKLENVTKQRDELLERKVIRSLLMSIRKKLGSIRRKLISS